jgi:hypothetical protein
MNGLIILGYQIAVKDERDSKRQEAPDSAIGLLQMASLGLQYIPAEGSRQRDMYMII